MREAGEAAVQFNAEGRHPPAPPRTHPRQTTQGFLTFQITIPGKITRKNPNRLPGPNPMDHSGPFKAFEEK